MDEEWEIVKIVGTTEEATIVVGFLQSSGIDSEAESLRASEFPTDIGDLANINIRVPADRAEEAKALLNQREDVATGDEGAMAALLEGDVDARALSVMGEILQAKKQIPAG